MPANCLHQGKYRHLAELDLADFYRVGDELQIDALIGSDHYWQLVSNTGRELTYCDSNTLGMGFIWSCVWCNGPQQPC